MKLSPSFLSCDFSKLESEIKSVSKASWLHFDVMDGSFVENTTYNQEVVKEISHYSNQFFDVHLMITDPYEEAKNYAEAGASLVTFHYESDPSLVEETIQKIKSYGIKVGCSIKPATDVDVLLPYLKDLDLVLIMSVEPGKGGQKFLPSAIDKIKHLDELRKEYHYSYLIEVDGGINQETIHFVKDAGVDICVVGSFLFNQTDRNAWIEKLENE